MNEKFNEDIEKRLGIIEVNLDAALLKLSEAKAQQDTEEYISQDDFMSFYKLASIETYEQQNYFPIRIIVNNKFAKTLQHRVLYPDYNAKCWYVIGIEPLCPIVFDDIKKDYQVDLLATGTFKSLFRKDISVDYYESLTNRMEKFKISLLFLQGL